MLCTSSNTDGEAHCTYWCLGIRIYLLTFLTRPRAVARSTKILCTQFADGVTLHTLSLSSCLFCGVFLRKFDLKTSFTQPVVARLCSFRRYMFGPTPTVQWFFWWLRRCSHRSKTHTTNDTAPQKHPMQQLHLCRTLCSSTAAVPLTLTEVGMVMSDKRKGAAITLESHTRQSFEWNSLNPKI